MRATFLIIILNVSALIGVSQNATDNDRRFEEAMNYLTHDSGRNERKAMSIFEELAAKGYPKAQYEVAATLCKGTDSIPQDCTRASKMMKALADRGYEKAAVAYAEMLREGFCVEVDTALSYKYEKIAADKGNVVSMHNLAVFLRDGIEGVAPDTISAIGWFRRAAEKDFGPAQWQLSRYYHETGNSEEARYWLKRGADNDDPYCNHGLGLAYKNGDDGFPVDEDMALKYFRKGAEKYHFLESILEGGNLSMKRKNKYVARIIYSYGVDLNDPECMLHYGEAFINENDKVVFDYYQKICDMQLKDFPKGKEWVAYYAFTRRALCYYLGKGCPQNKEEGAKMLYFMADKSVPTAIDYIRQLNIPRP